MSGVTDFWRGLHSFMSQGSCFESGFTPEQDFLLSEQLSLFYKRRLSLFERAALLQSKKSRSPIDMESGFVSMIHPLFAARNVVRLRIGKMRFHLFHRVLCLSEP